MVSEFCKIAKLAGETELSAFSYMAVSETADANFACSETTCNDFSSRFFQHAHWVSLRGWEAAGHALRNLRASFWTPKVSVEVSFRSSLSQLL